MIFVNQTSAQAMPGLTAGVAALDDAAIDAGRLATRRRGAARLFRPAAGVDQLFAITCPRRATGTRRPDGKE